MRVIGSGVVEDGGGAVVPEVDEVEGCVVWVGAGEDDVPEDVTGPVGAGAVEEDDVEVGVVCAGTGAV